MDYGGLHRRHRATARHSHATFRSPHAVVLFRARRSRDHGAVMLRDDAAMSFR
jgi:hypothetical protein